MCGCEESCGFLRRGAVDVGPQLITSDGALGGPFNRPAPLGRNAAPFPVGDRHGAKAERRGESGLVFACLNRFIQRAHGLNIKRAVYILSTLRLWINLTLY